MAGKLQFGIEMVGGEAIEAQLSRIVALQNQISTGFVVPQSQANQTIKSIEGVGNAVEETSKKITKMKGYGLADLPKLFSKSGFVTPDISKEIQGMFKNKTSLSKFEAMENLSRAGGSQDLINQMAEMAKQDSKLNKSLDESARLQSALKRSAPEDKLANALLNGKWTYTPNKGATEQISPQLAAWRESMSKIQPTITMPNSGQGATAEMEAERIKKVESLLGHSVGITPEWLRKQNEEAARVGGAPMSQDMGEREKSIKREAMEAKRLDQINMDIRRKEHDHAKFMKDMTFAMMPLMNPGSVWGTLFGARQMFSAFMTNTGQEKIGKFGFSGVGGAASAMGIVMVGLTAAGLALKALGAIASEAGKAIADGMKLYSKSLMSGLGLGFTTQRSVAAGLLGVPENQLLRFGAALAWLQPRIAEITKTMAQNAIPLATLSVEWNIMKLKLENVAGTLAVKLKPILDALMDAIGGLLDDLGVLVKAFDFKPLLEPLIAILGFLMDRFNELAMTMMLVVKVANVFVAFEKMLAGFFIRTASALVKGIGDIVVMISSIVLMGFGHLYNEIVKMFPKLASALGLHTIDTGQFNDAGKAAADDFAAAIKDIFNTDDMENFIQKIKELFGADPKDSKDKNLLPPPLTMMKQLPVSAWEKMGLVIASGNNQALDYSRRTANAVETIAHHITSMGNGSTIPRANQFNLSPFVTNP